MTILDKDLIFTGTVSAPTQVIGPAVTDTPSTNYNDLQAAGIDIGTGDPLCGLIRVAVVPTNTSVTIDFVTSASTTISSSPNRHWTTGVRTVASGFWGSVGQIIPFMLPPGDPQTWLRYMGYLFTTAGTGLGGTYETYIVRDVEAFKAYTSGLNFS